MTKCGNAFSSPHSCKVGETMEEKHSSSLAAYGNEERRTTARGLSFCFKFFEIYSLSSFGKSWVAGRQSLSSFINGVSSDSPTYYIKINTNKMNNSLCQA